MRKRYVPFVGFTIFVGVVSLLGCAILSPASAFELAGEWESLDGTAKLKINPDKTFVLQGSYATKEGTIVISEKGTIKGTIAVSNDYIILSSTSKDEKSNWKTSWTLYFFIKESRLFLGSYVADGSVRSKWKLEYRYRMNIESSEASLVEIETLVETLEITDNKIISKSSNESLMIEVLEITNETKYITYGGSTNDYELIDGNKDIASLLVLKYKGNVVGTNAYVLADWKGKKMLFFTDINRYDSAVLKKKK